MAFFIPATFQKRLLRYVLSRLDLLEPGALALENLELAWGIRSTVELRDLRLHREKIRTLLHLPDNIQLLEAHISSLRLTVPADIYSSSISIDIADVQIVGRLLSPEPQDAGPTKQDLPFSKERRKGKRANVAHDSGGVLLNDVSAEQMPTADELARSFLDEESAAEKLLLADAIKSTATASSADKTSSDSLYDSPDVGIGTGFSLPTFLSSFLQGVLDRLLVTVQNISLRLTTDYWQHQNSGEGGKTLPASILIDVSQINVRQAGPSDRTGDSEATSSPIRTTKARLADERLFSIEKIVVRLVLSQRALYPPSESASRSSFSASRSSAFSAPNSQDTSSGYSKNSTTQDLQTPHLPTQGNESNLEGASIALPSSQAKSGNLPGLEQSPETSRLFSDTDRYADAETDLNVNMEPTNLHHTKLSGGATLERQSARGYEARPCPENAQSPSMHGAEAEQDTDSQKATETGVIVPDDLAHSRLFSHEEVASLYYSVASENFAQVSKNPRSPAGELASNPSSPESRPRNRDGVFAWPAERHRGEIDQNRGEFLKPEQKDITDSIDDTSSFITDPVLYFSNVVIRVPTKYATPETPLRTLHQTNNDDEAVFDSMNADTMSNIPGSFSQYAESSGRRRRRSTVGSRSSINFADTKSTTHPPLTGEDNGAENPTISDIDIELDYATLDIDLVSWKLVHALFETIRKILPESTTNDDEGEKTSIGNAILQIILKIRIHKISIRLFDRLSYHMITPNLQVDVLRDTIPPLNKDGILLMASFEDLFLRSQLSEDVSKFELEIRSVVLNVMNDDAITFQQKARMRTSVRDLKEAQDKDILLSVVKIGQATKVHITSLPMLVFLDIYKLDELVGSVGGLSSIIELGTSFGTIATAQRIQPIDQRTDQSRTKAVRFDNTTPQKADVLSSAEHNIRIAGILITLKSPSCQLDLQSSAVKIVNRSKHLGCQVDDLKISEPLYEGHSDVGAELLRLKNVRVDFMAFPSEPDLDQLIDIVAPSSGGYNDNNDIMLDTLVGQRKRGSLLKLTISSVTTLMNDLDVLRRTFTFVDEVTKMSAVTKYLPKESRPGTLVMCSADVVKLEIADIGGTGALTVDFSGARVVYIAVPCLAAFTLEDVHAAHSSKGVLLKEVPGKVALTPVPMLMARLVGDDLETSLKVKMNNMIMEYNLPFILLILGLTEGSSTEDLTLGPAASVATITDRAISRPTNQSLSAESERGSDGHRFTIDVSVQDSTIGLTPSDKASKGLLLLVQTQFCASLRTKEELSASVEVKKALLLIIDDIERAEHRRSSLEHEDQISNGHVSYLCELGYVTVASVSSAKVDVEFQSQTNNDQAQKTVDLNARNVLIILETCADSLNTLVEILDGLKPPPPPTKAVRYRTEVMPVEDMMASFSGDAYAEMEDDEIDIGGSANVGSFNAAALDIDRYSNVEDSTDEADFEPSDEYLQDDLNIEDEYESVPTEKHPGTGSNGQPISFNDEYFGATEKPSKSAKKWNSTRNDYDEVNEATLRTSPLTARIHDVHIIWNIFDGYDWPETRNTISAAVQKLELKAEERRKERGMVPDTDQEEQVIGDYLFNSIWIEILPSKDARELVRHVNHDLDARVSESGSHAPSAVSSSPSRQGQPRSKRKNLNLSRSKHHNITFELSGISADFVVFGPNNGETLSSIDLRVTNFEIFDHVPTSTWKKFATYLHDAEEREFGKPMIHIEVLNVKPVADLAASEIVLRVSVLPLRLHVDQDALDFIVRFFEFKDDTAGTTGDRSDQVFLQRVEVNRVKLKLDYKPKKIDYTGLRSGHTTELMNLFILEGSDIILHHVILYGVSGFDKLHNALNDIWMPDVKRNQLPGVLSGLAPVRSLVNVGSGVRDLVVIPMREYRKDGRMVRSIKKGAVAFARTTTSELARLGAKLAIGTQTVLQNAEEMLSSSPTDRGRLGAGRRADWRDDDDGGDDDYIATSPSRVKPSPSRASGRAVSNYADQPIGVLSGLRGAARSLERDLLTARDAIIAVPGEVMESGSAGAAAQAIAKRAPTIILRPAIGATRAVGMTLLGAGNALDKDSRRRINDKYKRV